MTAYFAVEVAEVVLPTETEVNALLNDLEKRKMLSDDRYAEMRTRLRARVTATRAYNKNLPRKALTVTPLRPLSLNSRTNYPAAAICG